MGLARSLFRLRYGRRLPKTEGKLVVSGLAAPISIWRDDHGIPYIHSKGDEDAWYGLGFCQGQDRAFQLEMQLRVVRGTLAELVGLEALPIDRLTRRIGFRPAAKQQLAKLEKGPRQTLAAFARGVREGATNGCPRSAHEFKVLGVDPTPYDEADALGSIMLQGFLLESNWGAELARLLILSQDGADALLALDPLCASVSVTGLQAAPAARRLAEDVARLSAVLGSGGGSNVWAVSGVRTASGRPLLANDPHLGPVLPPHWYLAMVRTPAWAVAGASFVGAPGFPAGHNGCVAWGVTAGLADNTDLYVEEVGPDGRSARLDQDFVPCATRHETIHIKGGHPVEEVVLVTPRGPIIGPALEGEVGEISLQATWLAPRTNDGLFVMHRAGSVAELRRLFAQGSMLSLSMAFADTSGAVAWQMVGDMPRRRKGWGTVPRPGWDPEAGWEDRMLDFADMPHVLNPEAGFVVSANNPPNVMQTFGFVGFDWLDDYRYARISEVLASREDWDLQGMQTLHTDQLSISWREINEFLLSLPCQTTDARQALDLLKSWDGVVSAASAAATVFELFLAEMARRTTERKAPNTAQWALGKGFTSLLPQAIFAVRRVGPLLLLLRTQPPGWFERPWAEECSDALAEVIGRLKEHYGDKPEGWAWGDLRPLVLRHPLGAHKRLAHIFNLGPLPCGGDTNTVCQASPDPSDPLGNPLYVPSLRLVIDVGNWEACRFALPGGQSGNPLSPHYADLLPYWQRGDGVPIAWSRTEIERRARARLSLVPAD